MTPAPEQRRLLVELVRDRAAITTTLTGLDSAPHGWSGELLTIALAIAGVAIFGYLAAQAVETIAREVAGDARRAKRRERMIDGLEDHFIICGYGRVGRRAAEEFQASGDPFVVIEVNADVLAPARDAGVLFVQGRASEDEVLDRAGLARARGLIASADSDAENVYITSSARARRPDLTIVARASDKEAERKLTHAGANRVVQPYSAAGVEMAKLALKPQIAAFLELVSGQAGPDLRFEEIEVPEGCAAVGQSIRELRIRATTGAVVIAIRRHDQTFEVTPSPDSRFAVGDVVIAIGTAPELQALEELFAAVHVAG